MQLTETYPKPQPAKQMQRTPWLSRAFSHVGRFACLAIACGGLVLSLNAHAAGWGSAASLTTGRLFHTSTLLPSGKVLAVGGVINGGITNSAELYDPASNTWSPAAGLVAARYYHTATLLPSGQVLVVAGYGNPGALTSAELYDPATNTWSAAGDLATARFFHSATLLPSGKVLVVAGTANNVKFSSAELYDPVSKSWSTTGSLTIARYNHTATLLPSGKVLVVGGSATGGSPFHSSAELYDPANNSWSAAGNLSVARKQHGATLLASGKVLITAGVAIVGSLNSAELYDPTSNTWSSAANLASTRDSHSATLLSSGKVLVAGGHGPTGYPTGTAELYDAAGNSWSAAGALTTARTGHTATLLPSGQVLVAAGSGEFASPLNSTEVYDLASNAWSSAGSLAAARSEISYAVTLLPSGKVLISGGNNGGVVFNTAELFQYDTGVADNRRPVVTSASNPVILGGNISLTGSGFTGDSEASGGATNSSATNLPLLQLRRVDNEQIAWTSPAMLSPGSATSYQSSPLTGLPLGPYLLTLYVNALASTSTVVSVGTSTVTVAASSASSTFGQSVIFTATVAGSYGSFGPPGGSMSFCDGGAVTDSPFCQTGVLICASAALSTNAGVTTATCTTSALATGSRAINAVYYGDSNNLPANSAPFSFVVNKANQSISFGAAPTLVVGATGTVNATATSGLAVSFSTTSTTCTVNASSGVVNAVAAGNCIIAADQAGNGNYNAAPRVVQTITVGKGNQSISGFAPTTPVVFGAAAQTLTATPGASSSPLTFTVTSGPCALAAASLSYTGAGSCVVTVNQATDANYNAAAPLSATVVVSKAGQSTTFGTAPTLVVGGTGTLSATATSALAVSFSTSSTTCTVNASSSVVNAVAAGNCIIAADQPGNGNYNAATQVLQTVTVGKGNQTLSGFAPTTPVVFGAAAQTLTATPGASSSPLVFSLTSGPCALAGSSLSYSGAGSCVVAVNQAADGNYTAAAPLSVTVVVNKANQVIVFGVAPSVSVGGTGTVGATGGASGNAITFTSSTGSVCTVAGTTVTGQAVGTCIIAADQLGNGNYNAATQLTQSFNVTAALPILDIDSSGPTTPYDAATDGVLLLRHLLGYRDSALTNGAISPNAQRNATQIAAHIAANLTRFDVDGDGQTLATTDGAMILRRLLGITNAAAITQGVKNSNRADADVLLAIDALKP